MGGGMDRKEKKMARTGRRPKSEQEVRLHGISFRLTDAEGFTSPAAVETPPDGEAPFVTVDLLAEKPGYDRILVEDAQVFPGVETLQEFMLVPTPELPDAYDRTEVIRVSAQPL